MYEIWKDVKGFEGAYQISDHGRLKSFKKFKSGKVLRMTNRTGWYFTANLQFENKKKTARIHRLVAEAFISNPLGLPVVNHIDGNKQNNNVYNLEWCSAKDNVRHAIAMNPHCLDGMIFYNKVTKPRIIYQYKKNGEFIRAYVNGVVASKATGICQRNILQVCNGEKNEAGYIRKSAGGYVWRFI